LLDNSGAISLLSLFDHFHSHVALQKERKFWRRRKISDKASENSTLKISRSLVFAPPTSINVATSNQSPRIPFHRNNYETRHDGCREGKGSGCGLAGAEAEGESDY
jgi:hypothetical protein